MSTEDDEFVMFDGTSAKEYNRLESKKSSPVELIQRANEYLQLGGLFNPELMNHQQVSKLIIDMRDALLVSVRKR